MNLPFLSYQELCGEALADVAPTPAVKHRFWIDFWRDAHTCFEQWKRGQLRWWDWLAALERCCSYAVWSLRDPGPACLSILRQFHTLIGWTTPSSVQVMIAILKARLLAWRWFSNIAP